MWNVLCFICAAQLKFWFQTDLGSQDLASFCGQGKHASCFWLFSPRWRVGHALRPIFMLRLVKIWQVISCGKFMQHLGTCLLWRLKLTEFCVTLMFLTVFFHCTLYKWNSAAIKSLLAYSWLVCLSGFWLRNTSLVNVGNPISGGIIFVFHLAWCVRGLKSLKRFWPYLIVLIVFSASRMVSLSNYFIWCLFFIPNSMNSNVVYGAISFMHVSCKIWDHDLTEYQVWLYAYRTLKSLQTFSHCR